MNEDADDQQAPEPRFRSSHRRLNSKKENRCRRREKLARPQVSHVDDDERRYGHRMIAFFLFVFVGCLALAAAANFAHAAGHPGLEFACGILPILLIGQFFFCSTLASARRYGYSWIAGLGTVTKESHPLAYWSTAAIPLLMGAGLTIGVIVAALRRWVL